MTITLKSGKVVTRSFTAPVKPCEEGEHDWRPMGDRRFLECSKCGNMKIKPKDWVFDRSQSAGHPQSVNREKSENV